MNNTASERLALRWRRVRGGWRCSLRIHRWQGYHDLGDGVNIQPISGYRRPFGAKDFRRCRWCGATNRTRRVGDDRMRSFRWERRS